MITVNHAQLFLLCSILLAAPLAALASQSSTAPPDLLAQAKSFLDQSKVDDAERTARQFLEKTPDSADGHFLLGLILFRKIQADAILQSQTVSQVPGQMGNIKTLGVPARLAPEREALAKESLAEFTAGAKFRTPSAFDLKIVALNYVLLGAYSDADKWLTRSLEWNPKDSEGWYYFGRTKYNENRFTEAVEAFQKCLALDPKNVKAEDNLGLSYAGLGRNDEAMAAYKAAMSWQASAELKNPGPYIDIADLLLDQNHNEEAESYLLQAIQIAPAEPRAHELLGLAYTRMDQLPKAQKELERAIDLSPQSANLYCMLAPVYRKQGLADKAKEEFARCAAMNGNTPPSSPKSDAAPNSN